MSASQDLLPSIKRYLPAMIALALFVGLGGLVSTIPSGCSVDPEENVAKTQVTEDLAQPVDDLTLAYDALETIPSAPDSAARAHYYFNKWMQQQDAVTVDEKLDPLIDNLPQTYVNANLTQELKRRVISQGDVNYLLQCSWLRDVSARVTAQPIGVERAAWQMEQEKLLGIGDAEKLAVAQRLFDWTVRNIQLDPLPPPPAPPKATTQTSDPASMRASLPGPLRGELGPGYGHLPWQTLLYGHGDAWERARIFILLARQAGLDVVMLAVPDVQGTGGSRPWLPALLLRGQLYLFDAALGLPVAGPEGKGIATLEQVVADPGLLRALDLPGEAPYPIGASDLTNVSALIDAELQSLAVRMRVLEPAISGKRKMTLTCRPSELRNTLQQYKHISSTSLWRVPIEAEFFQATHPFVLQTDPARMGAFQRQIEAFRPSLPLMQARHLHLQGKYEAPPEEESQLGARERYARLRLSEKQIESLDDSEGRKILGLEGLKLESDPVQRQRKLDNAMAIMRLGKHHATYWIALTHFESGNYGVAVEWFRDRVLAGAPDSPWHHGARYNLARCYEALGRWEEARRTYLIDDSPQRHGNLLRAAAIASQRLQGAETAAGNEPSLGTP